MQNGRNFALWKDKLNSGGHQFQQYQQNEQSPLILIELTQHKNDDDTAKQGFNSSLILLYKS
jgi:hypothetical protein